MEDTRTPRELVALQSGGAVPLASPRSLWWRVPTVAAVYFVAARLGFMLDLEPGFASSIWPATAGTASNITATAASMSTLRQTRE